MHSQKRGNERPGLTIRGFRRRLGMQEETPTPSPAGLGAVCTLYSSHGPSLPAAALQRLSLSTPTSASLHFTLSGGLSCEGK